MKTQYMSAVDREHQLKGLLDGARQKIKDLEAKKMECAWALSQNIEEFERFGALRPYKQLLVQQKEVMEQAALAFSDDGVEDRGDHRALMSAKRDVEKKLAIVEEALQQKPMPASKL